MSRFACGSCVLGTQRRLLFFETFGECKEWHVKAWSKRLVQPAGRSTRGDVRREWNVGNTGGAPYKMMLPDVARGLCSVGSKAEG